VVKGKGRAILVDDDNADLAIAPALATATQSTVDRNQKCNTCGNQDQALFILDRKNGDIICSNCGTVVSESLMHEGSQYRKFEGEVDRNHHGDAANPLFSNAQNMSTSLGGATMTTVTRGMGGKSNLETILRNAHAYTELNLSNFGKNDRRTRTGYKDRQKKEAFVQMAHVGDALNLHEAVIQRAKELFAGFRDDRELVQQFKGVIGRCAVSLLASEETDARRK
jgi:transcription initiation factor TFIIIB Brf1 subunit/transcription initiation factor TFIIB